MPVVIAAAKFVHSLNVGAEIIYPQAWNLEESVLAPITYVYDRATVNFLSVHEQHFRCLV
jgi:hypothetical protein